MMHPWDKERTWQTPEAAPETPSGSGAMMWLIAIIIAVIGLALLSKHGPSSVVVIPIGISLFFMVMFLFSHRRETRRIAWKREVARMQQAHQQQVIAAAPHTPSPDSTLRKVFDRYDLKVIHHGRDKGWSPDRIASFLDYARDYVDTHHAGALIGANERGELDRHLDAALQRASLQYDIEHKTDSTLMEPPF